MSRSGYYAWAARQDAPPGPRAARTAELTVNIRKFHTASDQVNGAPAAFEHRIITAATQAA